MRLMRPCTLVLLWVYAFAAPRAAQAVLTTKAAIKVFALADGTPPSQQGMSDEDEDASARAAGAVIDIGPNGGTAVAQANARSFVGDIELSGNAQAFGAGFANADVEASAEWRDGFLLSAPGLSRGDSIKFEFLIFPGGIFSGDATLVKFPTVPGRPTPPNAAGGISGSLDIYASNFLGQLDRMGSCLGGTCATRVVGYDANGNRGVTNIFPPDAIVASMTTPNDVGNLLTIGGKMILAADASRTAEAEISGFFTGSLHWGGIQNVRNAVTNEPILDWTITSDSGFDYSKPFSVPEPSAIVLLLIGYGYLGVRRRYRE